MVSAWPAWAAQAGSSQRRTSLPEAAGVQSVATDGANAYVVWADAPEGHSAAISNSTGRIRWHTATAPSAALIATGGGLVWTAQNTGPELVEQSATDGSVLARLQAPTGENWSALTAAGTYLYGLTYGGSANELLIYWGSTLVGRTRLGFHADACHMAVGDLVSAYLVCFGSPTAVYRISTLTGQILAVYPRPDLDGGENLAYANGDVYVIVSPETNQPPTRVLRLDGATLEPMAESPPLQTIGIAAAGRQIVALQGQGTATPGAVVTLDPETLQPTGSASVQGDGYPMFFTATPDAAYVVEARSTSTLAEDLVRVDVATSAEVPISDE
jgi:hypothetical protein